jgi:DNA polymerase III delta prime subunit
MNNVSLLYKYKPTHIDDLAYLFIYPILKQFLSITGYKIILQGNSTVGKTTIIKVFLNELKGKNIFLYEDLVKYNFVIPLDKKNPICVIDNLDLLSLAHQIKLKTLCDRITLVSTCTSYNKIVESLMIKMTILNINYPSHEFITAKLNTIITRENIVIDNKCIDHIIKLSNNSIGSSINYLEKIKVLDIPCTYEICTQLETNIGTDLWYKYSILCQEGKLGEVKQILNEISQLGFSVLDILDSYYVYVKLSEFFSEEISYEILKLIMVYTHYFFLYKEDNILLLFFTNKLILLLSNEPGY